MVIFVERVFAIEILNKEFKSLVSDLENLWRGLFQTMLIQRLAAIH